MSAQDATMMSVEPTHALLRKAEAHIRDAYFECDECGNRLPAMHFERCFEGRDGEVVTTCAIPLCWGYDRQDHGVTHAFPYEMKRRSLS